MSTYCNSIKNRRYLQNTFQYILNIEKHKTDVSRYNEDRGSYGS